MSRKTKPELGADDAELDDAETEAGVESDADAEPAPAANRKPGSKQAKKSGRPASRPAGKAGSKSGGKSTGKAAGRSKGSTSAFVSGPKRPAGKGGKSGRRVAPVKVSAEKPWGTIALFALVTLLFVGIVGYTGYLAWYNNKSPKEQALLISGIQDFSDKYKKAGQHDPKDLTYEEKPAVGGVHNPAWQNCMGDVYEEPIAEEHAVHSLEHGAIWITYQPDLPKAQVEQLADKVSGKDYLMLSPYPGQESPISLQAWGFQLRVDDAGDSRIDDFIAALRTQGPETGASCSGGITVTGDKPRELPQGAGMPGGGQPQPGAPGGGAPQPPQPAPGG